MTINEQILADKEADKKERELRNNEPWPDVSQIDPNLRGDGPVTLEEKKLRAHGQMHDVIWERYKEKASNIGAFVARFELIQVLLSKSSKNFDKTDRFLLIAQLVDLLPKEKLIEEYAHIAFKFDTKKVEKEINKWVEENVKE